MKDEIDSRSLEELCAPLSAKVMPRSAWTVSTVGGAAPHVQLSSQRHIRRHAPRKPKQVLRNRDDQITGD